LIPNLREKFNRRFSPQKDADLFVLLERRTGTRIDFRVAETPIFVEAAEIEQRATTGAGSPAILLR